VTDDEIDQWLARENARHEVEAIEGWRGWIEKIPEIPVLAGWRIRPLPPYAGALARFTVVNSRGEHKSVYLDPWERLGCWDGEPYWEVYPVDGDTGRCDMADIPELVRLIEAPRSDRGPMVDRNTGAPAGPQLLTEDPDHGGE
jgi:hypothetical protein